MEEKIMLFSKIFGALAIIFAIAYIIFYAVLLSTPTIGTYLSIPMIISGWGLGIFVILAIVMFVLKK